MDIISASRNIVKAVSVVFVDFLTGRGIRARFTRFHMTGRIVSALPGSPKNAAVILPCARYEKKSAKPCRTGKIGLAMPLMMCYNISRLRTRALWFLVP